MVKWKTGLNCRCRAAIIGKQINLGLEISMNDTNIFNIFTTFSSELTHCADINMRHSLIQTYFGAKLTSSYIYVRPKLKVIGHFVRWPCRRYFKAYVF
jgi:hypothetical protein